MGLSGLLVGASGAIFGLLGALAAVVSEREHLLPRPWVQRQQRLVIGLLFINMALGLKLPFLSLEAHLGGLLAGLVVTVLLERLLGPVATGVVAPSDSQQDGAGAAAADGVPAPDRREVRGSRLLPVLALTLGLGLSAWSAWGVATA